MSTTDTLFSDLGLMPELLSLLQEIGYERPTPIQEAVIPVLTEKNTDLIALAETGSGKTAAYGLPLLQKIDPQLRRSQALILCPTRELCMQITRDLVQFAKFLPKISVESLYGGVSFDRQVDNLNRGVHVIVATPGRLLDHLTRKTTRLSDLTTLVLDEADEMLNMGFEEDLKAILDFIPEKVTTWLFSATLSPEIRQIGMRYMENPVEISAGGQNTTAGNITHRYYLCKLNARIDTLKRVIDYYPDMYGMIFTRTKAEAQEIAEKLIRDGYSADALHGDMTQAARTKVLNRFREQSLKLLIATDVAARGLDIPNITHIIHYGLPDDIESYIHRSGRTARAGKSGYSIVILTQLQQSRIFTLQRTLKISVERCKIPSPSEVIERRLLRFFQEFHSTEYQEELIENYLPTILQEVSGIERDELLRRFVWLEFRRFMDYYQSAPDLNVYEAPGGRERDSEKAGRTIRFHINIGSRDGFEKFDFIDFVSEVTRIPGKRIQRVQVCDTFSFFEAYRDESEKIIELLEGKDIAGRKVHIEIADPDKRSDNNRGRKSFGRSNSSRYSDSSYSSRDSYRSKTKYSDYDPPLHSSDKYSKDRPKPKKKYKSQF
ncbi:MAG: DEAD/DEAH box helicase [Bacteroidia bacterium]|nr:DEAD/DEAH box helicase [Bacteroidia bacterium]